MPIRVNLTDVSSGFDPIPNGWYKAFVTGGEVRESGPNAKNPGAEYINWEFTISEGEHEGRKQWMNTSLLKQALFGLKGLLRATGRFDDAQLESDDLVFEISDEGEGVPFVVGSEVMIMVNTRQYEGEDRNEIKRVKAVGEVTAGSSSGSLLP